MISRKVRKLEREYAKLTEREKQYEDVRQMMALKKPLSEMTAEERERYNEYVTFVLLEMPRFCKEAFEILKIEFKNGFKKLSPEEKIECVKGFLEGIAKGARNVKNNENKEN